MRLSHSSAVLSTAGSGPWTGSLHVTIHASDREDQFSTLSLIMEDIEQDDVEGWLPSPHFKTTRLAAGGTVLTHARQSVVGSSDAALGQLFMTSDVPGQHRFLLTVAASRSSTGTGIRIGVASNDGSRVCGIRPWDGQLYPDPPENSNPRYVFLQRRAVVLREPLLRELHLEVARVLPAVPD